MLKSQVMNRISSLQVADNIQSILSANPILSSLSTAEIRSVAEHSSLIDLPAHKRLFDQESPAVAFYYLETGRIKLYRLSENGDEKIIEIIEPGNMFAFTLLFIEGVKYPVNASALVNSEVISINTRHFSDLLRNSTDLCFSVMAAMSSRMMKLIQEIDSLSLQTGSTRVKSYLLNHTTADQPLFEIPVSKKTLASHLSIKPETFSRIMRCLINSGQIRVNGKEIEVVDRDDLFSTICQITD